MKLMATRQIAEKLGIRVRVEGALDLIALADCGRIIQACKADNVLILGIEAFRFADGKLIPDTSLIADFSELSVVPWRLACRRAARSAHIFFDRINDQSDLWFDFAVREQQG